MPAVNDKQRPVGYSKERARFWGTSTRTMQLMIADDVPVDDPARMVAWYAALPSRSQGMLSRTFALRIHEERAKLEGVPIATGRPAVQLSDPDLAEFNAAYKPTASAEKDNLADIKRERAFYLFRVQRCRERQDRAGESEALKHYGRLADIVHDCELRAQRLGRDLGESFSASDVDRLGRAVAYWLLNSADVLIGQLATGLAAASANGPLDREAIRKVVDPLVIGERVLAPMVRASQVNAGVKLPTRFVEAMKAGAASVLEDGAVEFGKLYAQDSPGPVAE